MNTSDRLRQTVARVLERVALRRLVGDEDPTPVTPRTIELLSAEAQAREARTVILRFRPGRVPLVVLAVLAALLGIILGSVIPVQSIVGAV